MSLVYKKAEKYMEVQFQAFMELRSEQWDLKGGFSYGVSDEYGAKAVENPVHTHDFHATILHLLGLDHTRLTYRYSGRDFRMTDIHGNVLHSVIA